MGVPLVIIHFCWGCSMKYPHQRSLGIPIDGHLHDFSCLVLHLIWEESHFRPASKMDQSLRFSIFRGDDQMVPALLGLTTWSTGNSWHQESRGCEIRDSSWVCCSTSLASWLWILALRLGLVGESQSWNHGYEPLTPRNWDAHPNILN